MTLADWLRSAGLATPVPHASGFVPVPVAGLPHPTYSGLWHLSDHFVSSVVAGTAWLGPRPGHVPN